MTTTRPTVFFVCLHGSAKSLIAAEHFRRLAAARGVEVEADSAGLEPDADVPPRVIEGLLADGIDVRGRRPRQVTAGDIERASHVVAFGCDLAIAMWAGGVVVIMLLLFVAGMLAFGPAAEKGDRDHRPAVENAPTHEPR